MTKSQAIATKDFVLAYAEAVDDVPDIVACEIMESAAQILVDGRRREVAEWQEDAAGARARHFQVGELSGQVNLTVQAYQTWRRDHRVSNLKGSLLPFPIPSLSGRTRSRKSLVVDEILIVKNNEEQNVYRPPSVVIDELCAKKNGLERLARSHNKLKAALEVKNDVALDKFQQVCIKDGYIPPATLQELVDLFPVFTAPPQGCSTIPTSSLSRKRKRSDNVNEAAGGGSMAQPLKKSRVFR